MTHLRCCLPLLLTGAACTPVTGLRFEGTPPAPLVVGQAVEVRFTTTDERALGLGGVGVEVSVSPAGAPVRLGAQRVTSATPSGEVVVTLVASAPVRDVIVEARAGTLVAASPPLAFSSGVPTGNGLSLSCGVRVGDALLRSVPAFDATRQVLRNRSLPCAVEVRTAAGQPVEGAPVTLLAEAGLLRGLAGAVTDDQGRLAAEHEVRLPVPVDVAPAKAASLVLPPWMAAGAWPTREPGRKDPIRKAPDGSAYTLNPRDGLVTLLAATPGAEAFQDLSGDGAWNEGEPFTDLAEPCLDADDNGSCEDTEVWMDLNGNGQWDGPDGAWSAHTTVWTTEHVLWTGEAADLDFMSLDPPRLVLPNSAFWMQCGDLQCAEAGPPVLLKVRNLDPWLNPPAQYGKDDGCRATVDAGAPVFVQVRDAGQGPLAVYDSTRWSLFEVVDARRNQAPQDRAPRRWSPEPFTVTVACTATGLPDGGAVQTWQRGAFGSIE